MSNNEKRYRDVTEADIGKMVEVRDRCGMCWESKLLLDIDYSTPYPFKCNPWNWRQARIEVEEEEAEVEAPCPDPGEGYRLLSKDPPEEVIEGDEFYVNGRWRTSGMWSHGGVQDRTYWYRRKIEADEAKPEYWKPKPGEWCVDPSGKPVQFEAVEFVGKIETYSVEGSNTKLTPGCLKKWKPKVGERVKVRSPREGDLLDHKPPMSWIGREFDVGWINWQDEAVLPYTAGYWISFDWLEPVETFPGSKVVEAEEPLVGKQSHLDADYTLLPPTATRLVAECLAYGERKYGEGNYKRISIKDHLNHAVAHVFEHLSSDNTEDHLIHAATRLLLALELCSDKDRKYQEPKEVQGE